MSKKKDLHKNTNAWGTYDTASHEIVIDGGLGVRETALVLLHEVLHAVYQREKVEKEICVATKKAAKSKGSPLTTKETQDIVEEAIVDRMARGLLRFMEANKENLAWLLKR